MAQVIWTEPALLSLEEIADHIALDKPLAAKKLVQRAFREVELLREFPNSGSRPKELPGTEYRHLVVRPVRVFYRQEGEDILIVYLMRGEKHLRLWNLS